MIEYAMLLEEFDSLSYPLSKHAAGDKFSFSERRQDFILHRVESKTVARMALGSCDWLSEHAAMPVGFVGDEKGGTFLVCLLSGRKVEPSATTQEERLEFSSALVRRLAALHSQGFGCGGLSPEAVVYSGKEAKLTNPSQVFALGEGDSIFYEAVATLRSLVGRGFARKGDLEGLARIYLSSSPVCRSGVASHLSGRKVNRHHHAKSLAEHAGRLAAYF